MRRNRKKYKGPKGADRKRRSPLSTGDLEAHATDLLENRRYKEAIAAFKDLLQRDPRQPWLEALSTAYAGRAEELAAKGMIKEALAIWRGRTELCDTPLAEPAYIELLMQAGRIDTAIGVLAEHPDEPEIQRFLPKLRALAAAQALAGREATLDFFPGDDPVVRDFPAALAALQAYCQRDDGAVETHLKAIPFRSPYRDLRQILKALLRFDTDAADAERSLARIDSGSPFSGICDAMRAARLPNPEFMRRCGELNPPERRFATVLRGWTPQQVKRVLELRQLGDQPRPDALMRFLLRHREPLGQDWVRETAMRLLVHQPGGKGHFNRAFGKMSEFHRHRIQALHLEEEGDAPDEIFNTWREAYLASNQPTGSPDTDPELTAAMVLRRSVDRWLRTEPPQPTTVRALEVSLTLDPDDVPTYLKLIRHYRDAGELKDARRVLESALDRYPKDAVVLTEAVETALAGNAFKKAARFARQALERDPINARVRDILVVSHLSHARKQIRQGKNALARKELDEAANWARTEA
ncbi:MAG: tetratricopeptide repeat protein, partial [Pseudomonadota bacterium]|nr:tetratricopeptide repeat protein [Pseudomonadota bacterium]